MILCLPNVFYWRIGPAAFMLSTQSKHINKPYRALLYDVNYVSPERPVDSVPIF